MLGAVLSFLVVYAMYAFIYWLFKKKSFKVNVSPHKRIARQIWIYCVFLIGVAIAIIAIPETFNKFHRPIYGNYKGWYYPNGHFSNLRIGNLREESNYNRNTYNTEYKALFLKKIWEELDEPNSYGPYRSHIQSLITYDSNQDSETYGHGIMLHVFDLTEDIIENGNNEVKAYDYLINEQVNDSSYMQITDFLAPYKSIATQTMMQVTIGDDNPPIFKKYITLFANSRAYVFIFFADQKIKKPDGANTFDLLDNEFKEDISILDLHSFSEWKQAESEYNQNLSKLSWIYIVLYLICIAGAIIFAVRYLRNIGSINTKAAKVCKILSIINIITFGILGLSFIAAFCTIHHEYIREMYQYRFESFINSEYVASSILCYGAYFLLLIIPTNVAYVRSYTTPSINYSHKTSKHTLIYWIVRPFALITKYVLRCTQSVRDEYKKQISDMDKNFYNEKKK